MAWLEIKWSDLGRGVGGTELILKINGISDDCGGGRYTGDGIEEARQRIIDAVKQMTFEDHPPPEKVNA